MVGSSSSSAQRHRVLDSFGCDWMMIQYLLLKVHQGAITNSHKFHTTVVQLTHQLKKKKKSSYHWLLPQLGSVQWKKQTRVRAVFKWVKFHSLNVTASPVSNKTGN